MRNFIVITLVHLAGYSPFVAGAGGRLDFEELRAVLQTNLPGVTAADIEEHATAGLLEGFRGKVRVVGAEESTNSNAITRSMVFDGGIGYVRVAAIEPEFPAQLAQQLQLLAATNALQGVVLDLRFARGEAYAAAAAVADSFLGEARELLDFGTGMIRSSAKTNACAWPVVALVNGETAGAPEALAALLRETGNALILGRTTLGAAMVTKEITLSTGQRLRVAAQPVKLANGNPLPASGVVPDIEVPVTPADERVYWNDPYAVPAPWLIPTNSIGGVTNRPVRRPRTTEADLVRARREGLDPNSEAPRPRAPEPETPVLRDPALGRAVDLLKGLAVVRRAS